MGCDLDFAQVAGSGAHLAGRQVPRCGFGAQRHTVQGLRHRVVQIARQAVSFLYYGQLLGLFIQAGILYRHSNLVANRCQQRKFFRSHHPWDGCSQIHHAYRLPFDHQGGADHKLDSVTGQQVLELALGIFGNAPDHRPALPGRQSGCAGAQGLPGGVADEILGQTTVRH